MNTMRKRRTLDLLSIGLLTGVGFVLARSNHTAPVSSDTERHSAESPAAGAASGTDADSPAQIPIKGWWAVLKRVAFQFNDHRLMAEAASVVFFVLLAIFPAIAALVSLYGLFADPKTISNQLASLSNVIPGGGLGIIKDQVTRVAGNGGGKLGFGLAIGLAASLWSANAGMKALFDVLNVAYGEREKRGFVRLTLITMGFTVASLVFVMLALAAVVVVPIVLHFVGLDNTLTVLVDVLRWPLMLVVVSALLAVIYRYGPSRQHAHWRWVSWGGGFAAVGWVVVSLAFSYYVSNFGSYNKTYGSLGAAIGFMTWIWISVMVVLIGAELNAELEHQTARDSTTGEPAPLGERGASKADAVAAA
jgi:membrane protein